MTLRVAARLAVAVIVCGALVGFRSDVGPMGGWLFWSESPHGGADELGTIGRAGPDGSEVDERYMTRARSPAGIAIGGPYVYWANYATGLIGRARIDGSDVDESFIKTGKAYSVIGLAVSGEHIYWTTSGLGPNRGTIGRANLIGHNLDDSFIEAGDSPIGIAVDSQHIYWTHRVVHETSRGPYFTYAVGRADLDGSHVERSFIPVSDVPDGVAVNHSYVFWANGGEHVIGRANLDGSHVWQRCMSTGTQPLETVPEGIAVNAQHVYWTTYPADAIVEANLDGTDIQQLISLRGVPGGVAFDPEPGSASSAGASACQPFHPAAPSRPDEHRRRPLRRRLGRGRTGRGLERRSFGERLEKLGRQSGYRIRPESDLQAPWSYYQQPVIAELRASAIRSCVPSGRLVYTRFIVREQARPGGPMGEWFAWNPNLCRGI